MFAAWIPDALKRIEELSLLGQPPAPLAVPCARIAVVNLGSSCPAPTIEMWETDNGRGIKIVWQRAIVAIMPDGTALEGR